MIFVLMAISRTFGMFLNCSHNRFGGSNPPLSATLISLDFFQNHGSVATSSGNKSTLVWVYLPVSFMSDFAYFPRQ
jgi:hypothetical protein